MKITDQQIKVIHMLLPNDIKTDKAEKQAFVSIFTGNQKKSSTKDLSYIQANDMIIKLGGNPLKYDNWGFFDSSNASHRKVLSLIQEIGWVIWSEKQQRNIPDIVRLSEFLKSKKSPVRLPLKKMTSAQISRKLIPALEGISKSKF